MAVLRIVNGGYSNQTVVENLINYISNPQKLISGGVGGQGLSLSNPIRCIYIVKDAYCHNTGKQMEHFILSFDVNESKLLSFDKMMTLGYDICEFFKNNQIFFGIHQNTNNEGFHIHFAMNKTNMSTGHRESLDISNVFELKEYVDGLLYNADVADGIYLAFR